MDIPTKRRRSSDHAQRPSSSASYVERFAASYQRASQFEPVDTRVRRTSLQNNGAVENEGSLQVAQEHRGIRQAVEDRQSRAPSTVYEQDVTEDTALLGSGAIIDNLPHGMLMKSTTAQTIFNITNLLIGIGLLSLPLGMRLSGWLIGSSMLLISAVVTAYTAVLLIRGLATEPAAYAYSDIGRMAYGRIMTWVTALIFMLELLAAGSALTILFGDNFSAVIPSVSSNAFKFICFLLMLPATLLPLRILSYTSIIGILSTIILILVVFVDGLLKTDAPGSLHEPMQTDILPSNWKTVPLAIGLMMAPFGGHGIFPQVYTDMKHREQFSRSVWIAYAFSTAICFFVGIIGYLMFGSVVEAEITINLLKIPGYPKTLNKVAVLMTGITSLTKTPLASKAIAANIDVFLGLKTLKEERHNGWQRFCGYLSVRFMVNLVIFLLAFFFPDFDRVMSVLGSAFVYLISVILPTLFYLRIMSRTKSRTLSSARKISLWALILISAGIAALGTGWALTPERL